MQFTTCFSLTGNTNYIKERETAAETVLRVKKEIIKNGEFL